MLASIVICLALFTSTQARIIDNKCDGVIVRNINHVKDVLKQGIEGPYQLAIDYDTNTLFFSFTNRNGSEIFQSAYLNLKTNEYGTISDISGGFANAVDDKNHIVYLGGGDGIHKFDFNTKKANYVAAKGTSVWQMFFKDKLYYSVYPSETVYYYENGISKQVPELNGIRAMLVSVDNNDNIFYRNSSGLYCYKKAENITVFKGDYNANGLSKDINGNLYFSTPEGLYSIDGKAQQIKKLVSLDNVYGVAIESDNTIIYGTQDSIVRLKSTGAACVDDNTYERKEVAEDNNL